MKTLFTFCLSFIIIGLVTAQNIGDTFSFTHASHTIDYEITSLSPHQVKAIGAPSMISGALEIPPQVNNTGNNFAVVKINESAFFGDNNTIHAITSISFPEGLTSIEGAAFQGNSISSVIFPSTITEISDNSFSDNLLTTVTIPALVTYLGDEAFSGNAITAVQSESLSPATLYSGTFDNRSTVALTIPYGTMADYTAAQWTGFLSITEDISINPFNGVAINTDTSGAALHIKGFTDLAGQPNLKLSNASGDDLLTIYDDGTVSGTASEQWTELPDGGQDGQILQTDGNGNYTWVDTITANVSQLEKITEDGNTGWRLLGSDPDDYGDIGEDAIDLSFGGSINSGATGLRSVALGTLAKASGYNSMATGGFTTASAYFTTAMGVGTKAKSWGETVVGMNNVDVTPSGTSTFNSNDRAFVVGIGNSLNNRNDGLIVYKNGTLELDLLSSAPSTTSNRLYVLNNKLHYNGKALGSSQLEQITEGGNTGWRLLGRNPDNYGNIGDEAVDFSYSIASNGINGALGDYSFVAGSNNRALAANSFAMGAGSNATGFASNSMGFATHAIGTSSTAMGLWTTAKSFAETVVGSYNTDYTASGGGTIFNSNDRAFVVGIGNSNSNKNDGFIVYKNGTLELDLLSSAPSTTSNRLYVMDDQLHYNGKALGSSQLEQITEAGNTGWRLLGSNPANYGDIGNNALDLSHSSSNSSTFGATGSYSTALGRFTTASGTISTAMGRSTTASGSYSTAMGLWTTAKSFAETVVGSYNTDYTASGGGTIFNSNDRAFVVGIGNSNFNKNDGFIVYKNGTLELDLLSSAPSNTYNRLYVLNNKLHYDGNALGGASELEKITEAGKTGWRLANFNPSNYGNIGQNAVDLSYSNEASNRGATGDYSTAMGWNTVSRSFGETALGTFNTNYTATGTTFTFSSDRAFVVGYGTSTSNRKDAMTILKNGKVGIKHDNFENTNANAALQVNGTMRLTNNNGGTCNANNAGTIRYLVGTGGNGKFYGCCQETDVSGDVTYSWKLLNN